MFRARSGWGFSEDQNSWEFLSNLSGRKQHRRSIRYHDRMLVMCRWTAVSSFHSPAVLGQHRPARTGRNDGFHGDHEAFGEDVTGIRVRIVGNPRLFVDGAPNAVFA